MKDTEKHDGERYKMQFKAKHTIKDIELYAKDKAKLGGLILEGMKTTGGTDIDWLIEHHGGFIVMENKEFKGDYISIKQGQMIAFERLHEKLDCDGKCHFLVFGFVFLLKIWRFSFFIQSTFPFLLSFFGKICKIRHKNAYVTILSNGFF